MCLQNWMISYDWLKSNQGNTNKMIQGHRIKMIQNSAKIIRQKNIQYLQNATDLFKIYQSKYMQTP
jgi:hypothetical protein